VQDAETPPPRPCVEVLEGRSRGRVFELTRRPIVIGRSPGADLLIEDAGVSRRHIKLSLLEDGSVIATDLRSTNGMIINGEKAERATLREGDLLRLGPDAVLRFSHCGAEAVRARQRDSGHALDASGSAGASAHDRPLERTEDGLGPRPAEQDDPALVARRPKLEELPLSARQIEVGRLVATGMTNAAIAEQLGISHRTVTSHLDHIYGRLGIGSRASLTRWIVERGLLEP